MKRTWSYPYRAIAVEANITTCDFLSAMVRLMADIVVGDK